jgi:hypothetical protein
VRAGRLGGGSVTKRCEVGREHVARGTCHFLGKPGPFLYGSGHLSSCRDYFTSVLKFHKPLIRVGFCH